MQRKKHEEEMELQRRIRQLKSSGIQEKHLLDWRFDIADDNKDIQMAKRYVENWKKVRADNLGLLLWGDVGTGKSFVAACIANALIEKNIPVLMTNFSKILNQMGAMYEAIKKKPKSFEELVRFLQEADYEYKGGKQPAFRKKGQKRFIRLRSLDPEYSKENLEAIIAGEKSHKEKTYSRQKNNARPQMSLLIDVQTKLQQGKGAGYERWAKVFNLKQMAQAMVFYENHKFRDYGELEQLAAESVRKTDEMLASIKADEQDWRRLKS